MMLCLVFMLYFVVPSTGYGRDTPRDDCTTEFKECSMSVVCFQKLYYIGSVKFSYYVMILPRIAVKD
jgi:hypothetical protein